MATPSSDTTFTFPDNKCRILIVGKTGSGKSSTGNTLLGGNYFEVIKSLRGVTETCQRASGTALGVKMEVIDTPGLCHPGKKEDKWAETQIAKCLACLDQGPNIILLTIGCREKPGRECEEILTSLKELFGPDCFKHVIIVFTGIDELDDEIEKNLDGNNDVTIKKIKQFATEAGARYIGFSNTASQYRMNKYIKELLRQCEKVITVNEYKHYLFTSSEFINQIVNEQFPKDFSDDEKRKILPEILKDILHPSPAAPPPSLPSVMSYISGFLKMK